MQTNHSLTEAARRVVDLAEMLAEQGGREYCAADLLHALWLDESRGQEWLAECGIRATNLLPSTEPADGEQIGEALLREHVRRAERLANSRGARVEVGTEHLLLALFEHDPALCNWAAERGVVVDKLRSRLSESASTAAASAIDTEVRLRPTIVASTETVLTDRLIDAAGNRGREALRVLEDVVRFIMNDALVAAELKELRHALQQALERCHQGHVILARDTAGDVGTSITLPTEMTRGSLLALVRSNAARAQEALRSLEEVTKLSDSMLAGRLEQLRYRVYTLETLFALARFLVSTRLDQARLCLLVTDALCRQPIGQVVRQACAGGVDMVQLREKSMSDRRLRELAGYVREWTAEAGVLFIMNDRPDIAALVGADGVHVGQDDLPIVEARRIVGGDKIVGTSTHNPMQLRQAILDGADYVGVGPVFASTTKDFSELAGLEFVREVADQTSLPWFAIGGINAENVCLLGDAGGGRVAVSALICQSEGPLEATRQLRAALEQATNQPFASSSVRTAP